VFFVSHRRFEGVFFIREEDVLRRFGWGQRAFKHAMERNMNPCFYSEKFLNEEKSEEESSGSCKQWKLI